MRIEEILNGTASWVETFRRLEARAVPVGRGWHASKGEHFCRAIKGESCALEKELKQYTAKPSVYSNSWQKKGEAI